MTLVPYPMPPRMKGTVDNPGRQPSVVQALGLIAGVALIMLVVLAALSGGAGVAVEVGVGAALGAIVCATCWRSAIVNAADRRRGRFRP